MFGRKEATIYCRYMYSGTVCDSYGYRMYAYFYKFSRTEYAYFFVLGRRCGISKFPRITLCYSQNST